MTELWLGVDLLRLGGPAGLGDPMDRVALIGAWWDVLGFTSLGLALAASFLVGKTGWPVWAQRTTVFCLAALDVAAGEAQVPELTDIEWIKTLLFTLGLCLLVNAIARRRARRKDAIETSRAGTSSRAIRRKPPTLAVALWACGLLGCMVGVVAIAWGAAGLWTTASLELSASRHGAWLIYAAITTFGLVITAFCVRELRLGRVSSIEEGPSSP